MSEARVGRYEPSLDLLRERRLRRIACAALDFEEARALYGPGTEQCTAAVEVRKAARRELGS